MKDFELDQLNDLQYDVLKEIGNIGAGNATTALAKLLNSKIDMNVPSVALVPFSSLATSMGPEDSVFVGVLLQLEGDVRGMMMFLLDKPSAHHLVDVLMGTKSDGDAEFSDIGYSALNEIGNIICGAYLSALSGLTNLTITVSVPSVAIDMVGALLSVPAIEFGKIGDKVLFIKTQFGEDDFINGYFLMIPELESYNVILNSLGM